MAAITQINSGSISPLAGPWLSPCARTMRSFFCLFKFLFALLKSSSSINICQGPVGSNLPRLHLLFTSADVVVPPLLGLNHIIISYFQHLSPAVFQTFSNPTPWLCPAALLHNFTFPALHSGEKCISHTPVLTPGLQPSSLYDPGGLWGPF